MWDVLFSESVRIGLAALSLSAIAAQPAIVGPLWSGLRLWRRRSLCRPVLSRLGLIATSAAPSSPRLPGPLFDLALAMLLAVAVTTIVLSNDAHPAILILPLGLILTEAALCDLRWLWLPDRLTLPLLLIGLALPVSSAELLQALLGVALAGVLFGGLRWAFSRWRGVEALGLGDVKLAATMGAWLGPDRFILSVVIAAISAIAVTLIAGRFHPARPSEPQIPFGAYLSAALFGVWVGT